MPASPFARVPGIYTVKAPTTSLCAILQQQIPGTLAKGLAGAHFGEKNQMKLKNETVERQRKPMLDCCVVDFVTFVFFAKISVFFSFFFILSAFQIISYLTKTKYKMLSNVFPVNAIYAI